MFNLFNSIKSLFTTSASTSSTEVTAEYNWETMGLKRGLGSNYWTDEKVSRLLDLLNKGYTYKQIGQVIQATRGQICTKVRQLRKLGIEVGGTSKTKSSSYKSNSISKKSTRVSKKEIDSIINQVK